MNLLIKNKIHFPSKFATGERSYSWVNMVNMKLPPSPSSFVLYICIILHTSVNCTIFVVIFTGCNFEA